MPPPLSPLTPSHQNSRSFSPSPGDLIAQKGVDHEDMIQTHAFENAPSSPMKMVDDANISNQDNLSFTPSRESQGLDQREDDFDDDFSQPASSSPFMEQGRDCTADLQMLPQRQPSLDVDKRLSTTRKRSFEHGPEDHDEEEASDGRFRKSASRREVPDINVYADEDTSFGAEQNLNLEGVEPGTANSMMEEKHDEGMSTVLRGNHNDSILNENENEHLPQADNSMIDDSHDFMDDTCLSTFSAVPNADMTSFAGLRGDSPFKSARPLPSSPSKVDEVETRELDPNTPPIAQKSPRKGALLDMSSPIGSPTPKRREPRAEDNVRGTPNLLDLTDQQTFFPRKRYSMQNERYSPSRRSPLRAAREPIRSSPKVSLLDFDIPAAPTPRSIPTVTPRELESLKSRFLSEISSLKATLSGREAEVSSLKQAVADAERRVGEALEEVRNEAAGKEALEIEQVEWQRRGQEMDNVLRSVRAEIVEGDREREQLIKRMEEAEKDREHLESRMAELEAQLSAARSSMSSNTPQGASHTKTAEETAKEVQDAVEKMAAELHVVYKKKHETKVGALKKSYEARWDKRVRAAEDKLKIVNEENEGLRRERDAALSEASRPNPGPSPGTLAHENEEHEAEKQILQAQIKGLQQEMATLKNDGERLHNELRMERAEKGELVAAVDEWLAIQQNQLPSQSPGPQDDDQPELPSTETSISDGFQRSLGRSGSSGIRPPSTGSSGPGEKKIPKIAAAGNRHVRDNSGGKSGIAVFTPGRSGIMGSIERMGRGGN
ncbi:hypothetical protein P170DRAFT_439956 [Aspergillus steynii IBT 23096]|uniref:Uncharacterized protein n=1 Tax=Aspergillus steynii IBT 23096 TaxID=1392250 RepID=A0A2I2FVP6_9EURO|nr:uncharacterized protein P170DRAFT_439956 [Aspergillus steynii IBT 23096]PLB44708.1 hypothetical protein P170DRAFT_439956 [Aspergillus steynii IBT 23096]